MFKKSRDIDMLHGPLFRNILWFAIPLVLSGMLQLTFNAVDIIVVGRFSGEQALAAVGSTSSLINLLVNMFVGIAVGANVVIAKSFGANAYDKANRAVSTAMLTAIWGGILLIFVGFIFSEPLLKLTGTPENVIHLAAQYMKIYFISMPAFMIFNFGSSIFRAVGDTKRPLYFLSVAGIAHIGINLLFVVGFKMSVVGVAFSSVISQYISAGLILLSLCTSQDALRLDLKHLVFDREILKDMLRIGLPAGFQGIIFNISNVLIQSSVNSFGSVVIAGNTAANNVEGFVYTGLNALYQAALSFTSQNMGAKKYDRIDAILRNCLFLVICVGTLFGVGAYLASPTILKLYTDNAAVSNFAQIRLGIVCSFYALCGLMEVFVGSIRGLGYSIIPMFVSLIGACLFRVIWIFTIFKMHHSLTVLYASYPITWAITAFAHWVTYRIIRRKQKSRLCEIELINSQA